MALPCVAAGTADVADIDALEKALSYADRQNLPTIVLGGGSNVLLPSKLNALVLRPTCRDVDIRKTTDAFIVTVSAGKNWHELLQELLAQGIHSLENLALIPGLVGASVIQNIGAYGVEVADFVESVIAYDMLNRCRQTFSAEQCGFAYRDSIFKQAKNRYWVDSVRLRLPYKHSLKCDYPALKNYLSSGTTTPSPQSLFDAVVAIRSSKLPNPDNIPNAGSFFKNPIVGAEQARQLLATYPDMPQYVQDYGDVKLAAGWLIEQCGWKGRPAGNVAMHTEQALVMVNKGKANLNEVLALQEAVSHAVTDKFSVALEREPILIGVNTCKLSA